MIHLCFALYDIDGEYSKYTGTAICSVLENTNSDITIHLLHDTNLKTRDKRYFEQLVNGYEQEVLFYGIHTNEFDAEKIDYGVFTVGALFRLKIAELLPNSVNKVIYLDSDVVVNIDISELWNVSLNGKLIAGKQFAESQYWICRRNIVPVEHYFNSGVLVMDLQGIRRNFSLWDSSMSFFKSYPDCQFPDNDALNYVFRGNVKYLDDVYNTFTAQIPKDENINTHRIFHFAGDFVDPLQNNIVSKLFFSYFIKTPWGTAEAVEKYYVKAVRHYSRQLTMYQKILAKFASKANFRCILFGASGRLNKNLYELISHKDIDYYVDNNCAGEHTENSIPVLLPDVLKKEKRGSFIVIVSSIAYYNDIKLQLESYGLKEDEDFFDGRWLLTIEQGGYDSQKQ